MTLSTQQIRNIMTPTPGRRGAAEALRRQLLGSSPPGVRHASGAQVDYLRALAAQETTRTGVRYIHPGHVVGGQAGVTGDHLEPADIAWLQRLPADPAEVRFDDARQLAAFAETVKPTSSDGRLVNIIWRLVKELHDRRLAETTLKNAERPVIIDDPSPVPALAAAVSAETPDLRPEEAMARAKEIIRNTQAELDAQRQKAIDAARKTLADLDARTAERAATTRELTSS